MLLNEDCIFILRNVNFIESWEKTGLVVDRMISGHKDSATRLILIT